MITGGCHCGSVRYSIAGEALRSALCACTDCRRSAGAPLVSWALFARDAVTVDGDPASYNSSRDAAQLLRPGPGCSTRATRYARHRSTCGRPRSIRPTTSCRVPGCRWLTHPNGCITSTNCRSSSDILGAEHPAIRRVHTLIVTDFVLQ